MANKTKRRANTQPVFMPSEKQALEALSYLGTNVHMPVFFGKLAAYGYVPKNEAEAAQYLQLGTLLAQAEMAGRIKPVPRVKQACAHGNRKLDRAVSKIASTMLPTDNEIMLQMRQAARANAALDPMTKAAALVFSHLVTGGQLAQ